MCKELVHCQYLEYCLRNGNTSSVNICGYANYCSRREELNGYKKKHERKKLRKYANKLINQLFTK